MRVLYGTCLGMDEWMDHEKWGRNRESGRGVCDEGVQTGWVQWAKRQRQYDIPSKHVQNHDVVLV